MAIRRQLKLLDRLWMRAPVQDGGTSLISYAPKDDASIPRSTRDPQSVMCCSKGSYEGVVTIRPLCISYGVV